MSYNYFNSEENLQVVSKELREERAAELAEEMGDWIRF